MENVFVKTVDCLCLGKGKIISGSKDGNPYKFCNAYFSYYDSAVDGVCCFNCNVDLITFPDLMVSSKCTCLLVFSSFKLKSSRILNVE